MTALVWDRVEDRRFETGIERGVLFPLDGDAQPWNGLVSVTENRAREIKSYYIDGIKFLDHIVPGSFSGKIQAYTYPDVLDVVLGTQEFAPGVNVHDQRPGMFHLSYRTLLGDVLEGLDAGYKLHLVYNLSASPVDTVFTTVGEKVDPNLFEWNVSGIQTSMWGVRPTNHLSFNSLTVDPEVLELVESKIYGTEEDEPTMPDLVELLAEIEAMT